MNQKFVEVIATSNRTLYVTGNFERRKTMTIPNTVRK